jgi:hypothetical protein
MTWSSRLKYNGKGRRLKGTDERLGNYTREEAYVMLFKEFEGYNKRSWDECECNTSQCA